MIVDLPDKEVIFIYGRCKKKLSEIDKLASLKDCPFDKKTIANDKAIFLSIINHLESQHPEFKFLNDYRF